MSLLPIKQIALIHSYDGSNYFGWQKTEVGPSIEELLKSALAKILPEKISLNVASRTDRGVHAIQQVAGFYTKNQNLPNDVLKKALNARLPKDIRIEEITEKPLTFHPTLDAQKKEYRYYLDNNCFHSPFDEKYSWHFPYPLDLMSMEKAAAHFVGQHNFSAFANQRKPANNNTICCLHHLQVIPSPNSRLIFKIIGNRFLYKMIRNIVGTLVYIGMGKLRVQDIPIILHSKNRSLAGITAPAQGLFLHKIIY